MNKIKNQAMPLLIVILSLLTFDFLYENQVKDAASARNEAVTIEKNAEPDQSKGKENTIRNPFTLPQSLSEKEIQPFETGENEGTNTKFALEIIL
ncbi:MAG: hypothetical protein H6Q21_1453 [Bacteroidetes bacterium]|nr:hypothetical protein [Bacteroidota bacterium]